ncbi:4Fe-4S binding protein [Alkaliphilus crotonatoxidans]
MIWSKEAEARIKKAPFFVQGFARKKAEEVAMARGKQVVEVVDLEAAKGKEMVDLSRLDTSLEGVKNTKYKEIKLCGGHCGCPLTLIDDKGVAILIEEIVERSQLEASIEKQVKGTFLYHQRFKAALSGCPNCCSQPQIKDIGIIGYARPHINQGHCIGCKKCSKACPEGLIQVKNEPIIDVAQCIDCGRCSRACPTRSIVDGERGFRVIVGGRLGRHPHLARPLAEVQEIEELSHLLNRLVKIYIQCITSGQRFSHKIEREGIESILYQLNS